VPVSHIAEAEIIFIAPRDGHDLVEAVRYPGYVVGTKLFRHCCAKYVPKVKAAWLYAAALFANTSRYDLPLATLS
jgi:hypothetical protein